MHFFINKTKTQKNIAVERKKNQRTCQECVDDRRVAGQGLGECSRQSFDMIPKTLSAINSDEGKNISSPFFCPAYRTLGVSEK
jgi:hypothetical protein